jgi:HEAT repeat protein
MARPGVWAIVVLALACSADAQSRPGLPEAQKAFKAGKYDVALAALENTRSGEGLRLKTEAAARAGKLDLALASYDALVASTKKDEPPLLAIVATSVLESALGAGEPTARATACSALAKQGARGCLERLRALAADAGQPADHRMRALIALVREGDESSKPRLTALLAQTPDAELRPLAESLKGIPAEIAVPVLSRLLAAEAADTQFSAAVALGGFSSDQARATLRAYVTRTSPRPAAASAARLSLAQLGDEEELSTFAAMIPQLQSGDLLVVGRLLDGRGDPRGADALERVVKGDYDLLKPLAAAALERSRPGVAARTLEETLKDQNPWMRAAALEAFRGSRLLTFPVLRAALSDPDTGVRTNAAAVLLDRGPKPTASPARPPK